MDNQPRDNTEEVLDNQMTSEDWLNQGDNQRVKRKLFPYRCDGARTEAHTREEDYEGRSKEEQLSKEGERLNHSKSQRIIHKQLIINELKREIDTKPKIFRKKWPKYLVNWILFSIFAPLLGSKVAVVAQW